MKFNRLFHLAVLVAMLSCVACCEEGSKCGKCAAQPEVLTDYSAVALDPAPMQDGEYVCQRPAVEDRLFSSKAIEAEIVKVKEMLTNERLAWMFSNCFPNTLDTTVHYRKLDGQDDTFVYTGDIHAMWLRDSGAQVWPYVQFANEDEELKAMLAGVIRRQLMSINIVMQTHSTMVQRVASGCRI